MPAPLAARTGTLGAALLVFSGYAILAALFTWPLVASLTVSVPSDVGDPVLNTWILWWNAFHLPLTNVWWNAPIFFPAEGTLAFSEHLLGLTPIATPVIRLSGNPLLGYNVSWLLTFSLSATAAYLLALDLTGRRDAAWLAGLAFGFSPYRVAQWSHLQVLAAYWMPIALLGLHRFITRRQLRWLVLFTAAFVMQALSNGYYFVFLTVLTALWVGWFSDNWRTAARISVAWLGGVAILLPFLLTYQEVHARYGLTRNLENMRFYSADIAALISTSSSQALWTVLPEARNAEGALFAGFAVMVLAALGAVGWRPRDTDPVRDVPRTRPVYGFYVLAAVVVYFLALGPSPTFLGERLLESGPYAWLAGLPGFSSLRAPARFGMLFVLCIAIAAAVAYARVSTGRPARWRWAATAALTALMAAEAWPATMPLWEPPRAWSLNESDGSGPLLVLPLLNELNEAASMYRAMTHRRPLVNGYSGHIPPWYLTLREGLNARDPVVLDELAKAGVTHVALVLRNDRDGSWRDYVRARAAFVRESSDGGFALFQLQPPRRDREFSDPAAISTIHTNVGRAAPDVMLDGRPESWWSTTDPQSGGEEVLIDLGSVQEFVALEMSLGRRGFEYPRALTVEISPDHSAWTDVWSGPTAGLALGASMRDLDRTRLVFGLGQQSARFVRLRQTGQHRQAPWTIAELRVLKRGR